MRFKLTIEYAGTRYSGWQIQKNARTVQGEIERALGDGKHDLMVHDRALQMRVGVVFSGLVMTVVKPGWRELLEPDLKVVKQSRFPVVHEDAGRDVHGGDEHRPFGDAALAHDARNLVSDADELLPLFGFEPQVRRMNGHAGELGNLVIG